MKVIALVAIAALTSCSVAREPTDVPISTATSAGLSNAEILYGYRCKGCHEPATPGAPNRKQLAALETREIVDALREGPMKSLATGLTRQEMRELAAYLTSSASKETVAK
jgi:cytochrome c553